MALSFASAVKCVTGWLKATSLGSRLMLRMEDLLDASILLNDPVCFRHSPCKKIQIHKEILWDGARAPCTCRDCPRFTEYEPLALAASSLFRCAASDRNNNIDKIEEM